MRGVDLVEGVVLKPLEIGGIAHVVDAGSRIGVEHLPPGGSYLTTNVQFSRHSTGLSL
jgi:hypothetical protein